MQKKVITRSRMTYILSYEPGAREGQKKRECGHSPVTKENAVVDKEEPSRRCIYDERARHPSLLLRILWSGVSQTVKSTFTDIQQASASERALDEEHVVSEERAKDKQFTSRYARID